MFSNFCMFVQKHNPASNEINRAIMLAFERGLTKKWPWEGLPMESMLEFRQLTNQEKKPMVFEQLIVVLLFLFCGTAIAVAVFAWEKFKRPRQFQSSPHKIFFKLRKFR